MADLNLDDLAVFVRVVDRGGFAGAARDLGVPTSTVSRAIERLEAGAGIRLLQRTTRHMKPTSEGRELYAAVAPAVSTLRAAARTLEPASRQPRGRLRVTAPLSLCTGFFDNVIVAFAERHPLVDLDFELANQHANLIDEGFDVAIRATADLGDSSLVARKLGDLEHHLYASPQYLQRRGAPATCEELTRHPCIVFRAKELARTWALRGPGGAVSVAVRGRVGGDDWTFVRSMIVAGAGIGLLPHINASADEASGRIVRVLPEWHALGASLYVVYPSRKNIPARVTAFRDFVVDAFASWKA
ncbi:MAG TPA: LysR family transcriptional regulator [Kofleriaceae bacterium]|jgi:DNA-binding transcriptional LysR family regulator|nr:LysR family transcriptional regulator [Kofleriaceae bacterium]